MTEVSTPPLSARVRQLVDEIFGGAAAAAVCPRLAAAGGSVRMTDAGYERCRIAVLKLSGGDMDALERALVLFETDYRDLLMAAGFGHDTRAHLRWQPGLG